MRSQAELKSVDRRTPRRYHQPPLIEEFIDGEEITAGLLGPAANPSVLGIMRILRACRWSRSSTITRKERLPEAPDLRMPRANPGRDDGRDGTTARSARIERLAAATSPVSISGCATACPISSKSIRCPA